jgi:hypothetical protein
MKDKAIVLSIYRGLSEDMASGTSSSLHYCIYTLLKHENDKDIDIYIYSNRVEDLQKLILRYNKKYSIDFNRIKFKNFNWLDGGGPLRASHKWRNILDTFQLHEYRGVLWLDCDIFVNRNIKYLFDRFENEEELVAVLENLYFKRGSRFNSNLDSGVMFFSRKLYDKKFKHIADFNSLLDKKISFLIENRKDFIKLEELNSWRELNFTTWTVEQVAGQDLLIDLDVQINSKLKDEGHVAAWPYIIGAPHIKNGICDITQYPICHYKNNFTPIFVPKELWHAQENQYSSIETIYKFDSNLLAFGSDKNNCPKCGIAWETLNSRTKPEWINYVPKPFLE